MLTTPEGYVARDLTDVSKEDELAALLAPRPPPQGAVLAEAPQAPVRAYEPRLALGILVPGGPEVRPLELTLRLLSHQLLRPTRVALAPHVSNEGFGVSEAQRTALRKFGGSRQARGVFSVLPTFEGHCGRAFAAVYEWAKQDPRTEFVSVVFAGDGWLPSAFQKLVAALGLADQSDQYRAEHGPGGAPGAVPYASYCFQERIIADSTKFGEPVVRLRAADAAGGPDPKCGYKPHFDLYQRIGEERFVVVPESLYLRALDDARDEQLIILRRIAGEHLRRRPLDVVAIATAWKRGLMLVPLPKDAAYEAGLGVGRITPEEGGLRVLYVQDRFCSRTAKLAAALRPHLAYGGGVAETLIGSASSIPMLGRGLDEMIVAPSWLDLLHALNLAQPDLLHCGNWPDYMTTRALNLRGLSEREDLRIIHDVHDLGSAMASASGGLPKRRLREEERAIEESDLVLTVSDESREAILRRYKPRRCEVYWCCPPQYLLTPPRPTWGEHEQQLRLVYVGHVGQGSYRDLRELFGAFLNDASVDLSLRCGVSQGAISYRSFEHERFHYHEHVQAPELYKALATQYDVGLVTFKNQEAGKELLDTALPNKLFDCLAAGLPVVVVGPFAAERRFVHELGVGLGFDEVPADLNAHRDELEKCRANVLRLRDQFTMDVQAKKVLEWYGWCLQR